MQMAKAHLVNMAEQRERLVAQRDAIQTEIEKISELMEKGLQEIKLRTIVIEEPKQLSEEQT